jgi:oxaloacetate decarboxylase gamma subunit
VAGKNFGFCISDMRLARLFNGGLLEIMAVKLIIYGWSIMNELISSGIELMLIGMGMVFSFLAMLIVAIKTMSSLILRFFPELPAGQHPGMHHGDDLGTIAAISAAVLQYRKKYQKKD